MDERVVVDFRTYIVRQHYDATDLVKLGDNPMALAAVARGKARGYFDALDHWCNDPTCKRCDKQIPQGDEMHEADGFVPVKTIADPDAKAIGDKPYDTSNLTNLGQVVVDKFKISSGDFGLLFPALVPAYGLKSKEWSWLCSDSLRDVDWSLKAFESLQLESRTKHLVESLVKGQSSKQGAAFDDVIPGKGQGLVFLLHG